MDRILLEGDPPVEVAVRRSARVRRLSLRVSALDGRVTLSMPLGLDLRHARDFAAQKAPWIRRHLERHVAADRPAPGGSLLLRGQDTPIRVADVRAVTEADGALWVPEKRAGQTPALLRGYLKEHARIALVAASDAYSRRLGRSYARITLRDTRSRWGSCTTEGNLMYSWRLIMAPPVVLDYVAAHEVAHLVEMNHSAAYWAVVARLCPDYARHRDWLRRNGASLHAIRFSD